jgi:hypothetical protein
MKETLIWGSRQQRTNGQGQSCTGAFWREHLDHSAHRRPGETPPNHRAYLRHLNEIIAKAILGKP